MSTEQLVQHVQPGTRKTFSSKPVRSQRSSHQKRKLLAWVFMLPLVLVNLIVIIGPSLATVFYAFTNWTGVGAANFVGLANFVRLFGDNEYYNALLHFVIWTGIFLVVPTLMGLLGAFLLSRIKHLQIFFRVVYFIPYVVASVINASIWENILDPSQGIGPELAKIGIPFLNNIAFFGNPKIALPAVAFVDNWHWWGFLVVLFLGAMQSVDPGLYEAAEIDGANAWHQFWNVTLPGIRPTLVFILIMTIIWSLLSFDYVYIITQGGPAGSTELISTLLYQNVFTRHEAGYAAAMGVSMSFIAGLVTLGYLFLKKRGWEI